MVKHWQPSVPVIGGSYSPHTVPGDSGDLVYLVLDLDPDLDLDLDLDEIHRQPATEDLGAS